MAQYINHGRTAKKIVAHIERTRKIAVDVEAAKKLMSRRGGFTQTLQYMSR